MDINIALKAFIRTVEKGSITGAARDLGVSQPAVTKHLLNLERHLRTRLLERSSKSVRPTVHGLELYEASRVAIASIDAALEGVRLNAGEIEGDLRIHAPSCIGARHLQGMVADFQDEHPAVMIELALDDRTVDLVYDNFDLTLRYGRIEDQEVVARKVGWVQRFLVASPIYLDKIGDIHDPQQLSELDVVATSKTLSPRNTVTLVHTDRTMEEVAIRPVLKTNNAQVMISALLRGRGVGLVQRNLVSELIDQGHLVRVLPEYALKPTEAYLAYPSTKFMRPVVRAFTDFVIPRLRAIKGISRDPGVFD
ncbi:LysR family transcriptional regulator [Phyllobacterium sp. 0TCS1.6C]|uniref:LysR family transcriptional regulator n=1 Tax=unclassified Phyllobacterium TaxID=2638441 RepID=UPI002264C2B0|nr:MULTISPECIES: LysR family transcriptional regulator [unclassified Phyllobacterium]MCX8280129.1 LysR family transcriptional regulator [Phyllobacterium sp. 0TCS1.6C]MCX8294309.1 LysR family transcriptional regulator [Phyllobacterium sp. 0TCS1.6A]